MTRERFEQILFAHVSDEVVQDMLNQYVLELESSNAKLRELVREAIYARDDADWASIVSTAITLGVGVTDGD